MLHTNRYLSVITWILLTSTGASTFADPVEPWKERITTIADLKTLTAEEILRWPGPISISNLYDHLEVLLAQNKSEEAFDQLTEIILFKHRLERELDGWGANGMVYESMSSFDGSLSRMLKSGLLDRRFSVLNLAELCLRTEAVFFSHGSEFGDWLLNDFLPGELKQAAGNPEAVAQVLLEVRNLFLALYAKNDWFVQELHRTYRKEFWETIYSKEHRRYLLEALGGGVAAFQDLRASVVRTLRPFDPKTKLFFLERLIESSDSPQEMLRALEVVGAPHYLTFPSYRVDMQPTIDMSVPERLGVFMKHELVFALVAIVPVALIYGPIRISRLFTGHRHLDVAQEKRETEEFKMEFWRISLMALSKIKRLEKNPDQLAELLSRFRRVAMLSSSQELMFKCRQLIRGQN